MGFHPQSGGGSGDVTAAVNITDNAIVRGDGGAKGIQSSGLIIDDSDNLTGVASIDIGSSTVISSVLDEDNMASDSATALATQQSIKKYVDDQVGTVNSLAEVLALGNTTGVPPS